MNCEGIQELEFAFESRMAHVGSVCAMENDHGETTRIRVTPSSVQRTLTMIR